LPAPCSTSTSGAGFKSNRKTDKSSKPDEKKKASEMQNAINTLRSQLDPEGAGGKARTVGELLWRRMQAGQEVRAKNKSTKPNTVQYDLYIDRAMIEAEFDALWAKQTELNPGAFTKAARAELKDCLLHQRPLKPVTPGRCTLEPDEERAPLALPSQQRFRIYQEVNNLRILGEDLQKEPLSLEQRNVVVYALEQQGSLNFKKIKTLLKLTGTTRFSLEDDVKREELKGNNTSVILSKEEHFGSDWLAWSLERQDAIVKQLLNEENEAASVHWLEQEFGFDERRAHVISQASTKLADGYGSLSTKALAKILPALKAEVITYDKAVQVAGYDHHSDLGFDFDHGTDDVEQVGERIIASTGEIKPVYRFRQLPYYGKALQRHVGFGTGDPKDKDDAPEKYYGKIANPTVHIGLNQVREVVNRLIKRYGHPSEVIVEVANELKRRADHRKKEFRFGKITKETMRRYCSCAGCVNIRQAINQELNKELRAEAAKVLGRKPGDYDMEKMRLWNEAKEINGGIVVCPYSGETLGVAKILSSDVEIDHILPHSITLDDGLANKVLCVREANRIKKERPPIEAKNDFLRLKGWKYEDILARIKNWPDQKRYRFGDDAMEKWKGRADTFLARSLNDTRYLSRIAVEYLGLICPQGTRSIPGQLTAKLREVLGLDGDKEKGTLGVLGLVGKKNRNDHRHHAVDACVIGVTNRGMLQKFSEASASARKKELTEKLLDTLDPPWPTYREHVERAVHNIWVSHKPDHGYEGAMMEATAYGIKKDGSIKQKLKADGEEGREIKNLIRISEPKQLARHGVDADGKPLPYIGYVGGSNYCIEIVRNDKGKWEGEVISTFAAYQVVREFGADRLRHPSLSISGKPLVMRLVIDDIVRMEIQGKEQTMRMVKVAGSGQIWFAPVCEANVDARNRDKADAFTYTSKMAGSLQTAKARRATISPIGELRDPGFKE
jgi:CRISPR-associated endonuclease Csn1